MSRVKVVTIMLLVMASSFAFYEDFSSWQAGLPTGWQKPYYQEGDWAEYNESSLHYLMLQDNNTGIDYALMHSFPYNSSDSFVIQARAKHLSGSKGIIFMLPDFKLSLSFSEAEKKGIDVSNWHEYTVLYNNTEYKVYVDGQEILKKQLAPGMTGSEDYKEKIWVLYSSTTSESSALIDYVFWEKFEDWDRLFLSPDCTGVPDANGYVKISASAGYLGPDQNVYCSGLTVSATGNQLKKTSPACVFSRYMFLPQSEVIEFSAENQLGQKKTVSCYFSRAGTTSLAVDVLSPESVASPGENLVKAVMYLAGTKLYSGTARVDVYDSSGSLVVSKPLENKLGNFITTIDLAEGSYSLTVTGSYEGINTNKTVNVVISSVPNNVNQSGGQQEGNWKVDIITPRQGQTLSPGIVPVHIALTNPQGFRTTSPEVDIKVTRNGELVERKRMKKGPSTYFTTVNATEPGKYSLGFVTISEGVETEVTGLSDVSVEGANATGTGMLDIEILTPRPDVYSTNATLLARAVVTKEGQLLPDANVTIYFLGEAHQMEYDQGDYVYPLPLLEEGDYSVKIFANYSGYTGTAGVDFQVSGHKLSITVVSPDAQVYIKESEKVPLRVSVADEKGDVVIGAFVTADVTEADGRTHTFQLYQSESTKTYSTVFYPNVEGVQKVTFTASKPGYVQTAVDYSFEVILKKKEVIPLQVDMSTVYLVMGVIALLIIVAALFKLLL